jgi:hypothetical protein
LHQISLEIVDQLTSSRTGTFDVPCPLCAPFKSRTGQRRKVLRIWRVDDGFAGFVCARCGEKGHTRNPNRPPPDPVKLARMRAEAAERERSETAKRLDLARWLWRRRRPVLGSVAETYLRGARDYGGPLPVTLGYLPATGKHGPAMIAAFGFPSEPEPGEIAIGDKAVRGLHITRLAPDGSAKAGTEADKIMVGRGSISGVPIVLAPINDLGGLVITEGIEDALSVYEATGLGAWAAGCASRVTGACRDDPGLRRERHDHGR